MTTDIVKTLKAALLPCPFCGGDAETRHERTGQRWHWCVVCTASDTQCAVGPETQWHDAEADAIAAWNRRALLAQGRGEVVEWRTDMENAPRDPAVFILGWCKQWDYAIQVRWLPYLNQWNTSFQPTHWRPLPSPPALKREASDEGKARDHGDGKAE